MSYNEVLADRIRSAVSAAAGTGKKAVSGGFLAGTYVSGVPDWLAEGNGPNVTNSAPTDDFGGWRVTAVRSSGVTDQIVKSYAICINAE